MPRPVARLCRVTRRLLEGMASALSRVKPRRPLTSAGRDLEIWTHEREPSWDQRRGESVGREARPCGGAMRVTPRAVSLPAGLAIVPFLISIAGSPPTDATWLQLSPSTSPAARFEHSAIYDPVRHRVIVFGGQVRVDNTTARDTNDVWVLPLDGSCNPSWHQLVPTAGSLPSARSDHSAVYDSDNDRMIVFGGEHGEDLNDEVGSLSFAQDSEHPTWTELTTSGGRQPCARSGHAAIYDPGNHQMMIHAGQYITTNSVEEEGQDTWTLALPANGPYLWTQVSRTADPFPFQSGNQCKCEEDGGNSFCPNEPHRFQYHGTIYDSGFLRMVIYGGWYAQTDQATSEVWGRAGGAQSWTGLFGASGPVRWNHRAVYDPLEHRMVFFGGFVGGDESVWTNAVGRINLDGSAAEISDFSVSGPLPTAREASTAVYDPVGRRMIVFGGKNGRRDTPGDTSGLLGDTWELLLSSSQDTTPPSAVSDMFVEAFSSTMISLDWTAPGDDGTAGPAAEYDLRRATTPITEANFAQATHLTTAAPHEPGCLEIFDATGLSPCTTYWFALKTRDAEGNWSAISNVVQRKTNCPPHHSAEVLADIPVRLELGTPQPSPARDATSIRYGVPAAAVGSSLDLSVYDVTGRRVFGTQLGVSRPGRFAVHWDLRATTGERVGPGVYFVRLRL